MTGQSGVEQEQSSSDSIDASLKRVHDYSVKMQDVAVLETMSPASKELYVGTLKKQRKELLQKMKSDSDTQS